MKEAAYVCRDGQAPTSVTETLAKGLLPMRGSHSSKGSFGRAYLLVGSSPYPGAALLASEACLRMGAGYTTLLSERTVLELALVRTPSILVKEVARTHFDDFFVSQTTLFAKKEHTSLLIGCGLSVSNELLSLLYRLFEREGCPLILDADALNTLATRPEESARRMAASPRDILLLPHPLEFARLAGISVEEVQKNRRSSLLKYQEKCKVNITLKGFETLTVARDGSLFQNTSGGPALAKAGTGDVLAGAVAALAAQGLPLAHAAALAAYLHGAAGDRLAAGLSDFGILPSELPMEMAKLLAEWATF